MKLCYLLGVVAVFWTTLGEPKSMNRHQGLGKRDKIVRKQHVPSGGSSYIRKQFIDDYGGGSLLNGELGAAEIQPNYADGGGQAMSAPANIANTLQGAGLSLDSGMAQGGNEIDSMSNDLAESSENSAGRQIGNGLGPGGSDPLLGAAAGGGDLGGGIYDGISAGLGGGGSIGPTDDSMGGASLGAGGAGDIGGTIGGGTGGGNMAALSDGMGVGLGAAGAGVNGADSVLGGGAAATFGGNAGVLGGVSDGGDGALGGLGSLGGSLGNSMSDGLAGLGSNSLSSLDGELGLTGLGSRVPSGGKQMGMADLMGLGGGSHMDLGGLGGHGAGLPGGGHMAGLGGSHQPSLDSQFSEADDENPSIRPGLTSILPGKTVHAHVSDKPTGNRPAVTGPSINAALQVQMEAEKQHQKRLKALRVKLKKLRKKLEKLQAMSKQNIIGNDEEESNADSEMETLNDLKKATQDAIKELHTDYPRLRKHPSVPATKHETLGTKLKTVDFTAKETGDTLEELLRLLDPELQDKKRGQVNGKRKNSTRLDKEAENKLASLTKKAEDEVDKLASQNPKQKPVITEKVSDKNNSLMASSTNGPIAWRGVLSRRTKLKAALLGLEYTSLGCWRDDPNRVVPSLENTSPLLKRGYRVRDQAVKKCAQVAKQQGFVGFALENGGQCFGGQKLLMRYKMYGKSRDCAHDGRGGDYAMEVYRFSG